MSNVKGVVTIKGAHENLLITITQTYNKESDMGHYQYVIFDMDGDVVHVSNSIGVPPAGKINADDAKEFIMRYIQYNR